ncbi:MAG: hypothetical protein CMJ48_12875 [Planctomycetaceae bacterium]|nr:hypothetical protein [Planctomycetaceae bacterium]
MYRNSTAHSALFAMALVFAAPGSPIFSENGFDLSDALIPRDEIRVGIPGRDAIPALHAPKFLSGDAALKHFGARERVLVVRYKGEAKAYPLAVLNWHEIVNDTIAGLPIVVTYCPLCGTGIVFLATVRGEVLRFRVSGLLYQSDVLLYDEKSNSLWSQVLSKAVTGKFKGTSLETVGSTLEPLGEVVAKEKKLRVLSTETGHVRDYDRDPYRRYSLGAALMFPVDLQDAKVAAKAWCVLLRTKKESWIVPLSHLDPNADKQDLKLGKLSVTVEYDARTSTINCPKPPQEVTCIVGYYFALRAFHHDAKLYPKQKPRSGGKG